MGGGPGSAMALAECTPGRCLRGGDRGDTGDGGLVGLGGTIVQKGTKLRCGVLNQPTVRLNDN
jgi:hypothetical protein